MRFSLTELKNVLGQPVNVEVNVTSGGAQILSEEIEIEAASVEEFADNLANALEFLSVDVALLTENNDDEEE